MTFARLIPAESAREGHVHRCRGCEERLQATHRPGCPEGRGEVLREHAELPERQLTLEGAR